MRKMMRRKRAEATRKGLGLAELTTKSPLLFNRVPHLFFDVNNFFVRHDYHHSPNCMVIDKHFDKKIFCLGSVVGFNPAQIENNVVGLARSFIDAFLDGFFAKLFRRFHFPGSSKHRNIGVVGLWGVILFGWLDVEAKLSKQDNRFVFVRLEMNVIGENSADFLFGRRL